MADFFGELVASLARSVWWHLWEYFARKHGSVALHLCYVVLTGLIGVTVGFVTGSMKTVEVFAAVAVIGAASVWYASRRYRGLI